MFLKVVQYKTLHVKYVTKIEKRNELCKENKEKF